MKNSLRQMMRTPVRTILFLILMIFATLLMTLGVSVWSKGKQTMEQYEDRFTTIATVRQNPDSFEQTLLWNAETKDYDVIKNPQYQSYYTPEDLLFPGVEYMAGPEQRAFYISYQPDYLMQYESQNPDMISRGSLIAEFSPMEDCVPDESVQIKITKVIGGDPRLEGVVDYFCDHRNPTPEKLYKDKTYVAILGHQSFYIHGRAYEEKMKSKNEVMIGLELIPFSLESDLLLPDGSMPEDTFRGGKQIFEVTDGFYGTDAGRRLLNLAHLELIWKDCQPVTGTNQTCLLMPFYSGQSYICEGRDISEEEYLSGSKVCLAPRTFMENNGLSLGDQVKVQLRYTDRKVNAGRKFWLDGSVSFYVGLIDTDGEPLEVFETSTYTVVGIYDVTVSGTERFFDPGADELSVPMKSIKARDGKNLVNCGPMTDATSSFRIPNGSVNEFLKSRAAYGMENLEFTFYDGGYSQLKAGMDHMRNLSLFLFAAGMILTGLLLFFFSHMFITKQAERTAIERSLGMGKVQCGWSVLSGFILLLILGSSIGAASGTRISDRFSTVNTVDSSYDETYTAKTVYEGMQIEVEESMQTGLWSFSCTLAVILAGTGIALIKMERNLRREPVELLSLKQEL
ncbi:MAG: hypothetical protein K2O15_05675 [Lachnospiraceae bacterium]|nr:hypothetical protein [Lachnospiraceae bacterium]